MAVIYCNTLGYIVKACSNMGHRRAALFAILIFMSQIGHSGEPAKVAAPVAPELVLNAEDEAAYPLIAAVPIFTKNFKERAIKAETLRENPGDRAVAAQIKAIDEQNGAMVQQADQTVAKFPQSPKILNAGAAVAIQSGDYKKGLAYADRAVTLAEAKTDDPKALAAALRTRATGSLWSGDYPKAAEDAQRVLKVFPDDKSARSIYEMSRGRAKNGVVAIATTQSRPLANALVENSLIDDPRLKQAGRRAGDRVGALKQAAEAMRLINAGEGAKALLAANATVESDPTLADG